MAAGSPWYCGRQGEAFMCGSSENRRAHSAMEGQAGKQAILAAGTEDATGTIEIEMERGHYGFQNRQSAPHRSNENAERARPAVNMRSR